MFYITTTPYRPCNKVIQHWTGLYDFYYTLFIFISTIVTILCIGYYSCARAVQLIQLEHEGKSCISCTARAYDVITDL